MCEHVTCITGQDQRKNREFSYSLTSNNSHILWPPLYNSHSFLSCRTVHTITLILTFTTAMATPTRVFRNKLLQVPDKATNLSQQWKTRLMQTDRSVYLLLPCFVFLNFSSEH